jgi:hypothetical protein
MVPMDVHVLYRRHKWPISCRSSAGPTVAFILPAYHDDCTDGVAVVDPIHTAYPVASEADVLMRPVFSWAIWRASVS